jgi:Domain of unknown function DUF29
MATNYETDIIAWSTEQAALLRSGNLLALDIEHIAEEILDVGKSEQRELKSRIAVLLAHLLKWEFQPERRSKSWELTIKEQRKAIAIHLRQVPSLKSSLTNSDWKDLAWIDAVSIAERETGMERSDFPENCPWGMEKVLSDGWLPEYGA